MNGRRGWGPGIGLMVLGPVALEALWLATYPALPQPGQVAVGWAIVAASLLSVYAGIHLLPLRSAHRLLIAMIYTPIVAYVWIMGLLVLGCVLYRDCL